MRLLNRGSLVESVSGAIAWGQALSIVRLVLSFAYSIIVIRALTPEDYGLYAFLYSILATSSIILSTGFEGVISRFASQFQASGESSSLSYLFSELATWRFSLLILSSLALFFFQFYNCITVSQS